jgi:mono/diheme cytochrome c family protein
MRTVLKWLGRIAVGLVVIVVLAAAILWFRAGSKMSRTVTVTPAAVVVPSGEETLSEGKRLATVYCSHCHQADFGGGTFIDGPLARIDAPNLTPQAGSATAAYTDLDWVRTVRHGVRKDGRSLIIMPSVSFWHLSDADLGSIVAYLKSAPPVDRKVEPRKLRTLGTALVGAGLFDGEFSGVVIDHAAARPAAVEKAVTAEYGGYLTASFGCYHCHGKEFAGQQPPDPKAPFAPNLTQGGALKEWNEEIFLQMARTRPGVDMPWKSLAAMTDDELRAVWRYLSSLPPRETPAVKS